MHVDLQALSKSGNSFLDNLFKFLDNLNKAVRPGAKPQP